MAIEPKKYSPAIELPPEMRAELYRCAQCGFCTTACEAARLKGWESYGPRSRVYLLKNWRQLALPAEQEAELARRSFGCTLCGRCAAVCQVGLPLRDLWLAVREQAVRAGHYPKKLDLMRDAVAGSRNVVNYPNAERADWASYLDDSPADLYQRSQAAVVYFVGCMASFSPVLQGVVETFVHLLELSGVSFSILGPEEWCCGYPLWVGGMREGMEDLVQHNWQAVRALGARCVVFTCPSCLHTWRHLYPAGLELLHASQFVDRLLREGRLRGNGRRRERIVYHDPCDLGRQGGVYDEPRRVLRSLGWEVLELEANRHHGYCCGGGGDLEVYDPDLSSGMARGLAERLEATGAQAVATACQQCRRTIQNALQDRSSSLRVKDLTELVWEGVMR